MDIVGYLNNRKHDMKSFEDIYIVLLKMILNPRYSKHQNINK